MHCPAITGLPTRTPASPTVFFLLQILFVFAVHVIQSLSLSLSSLNCSSFSGLGLSADREGLNAGVMDAGDHSAGGSDESPSEADFLWAEEEGPKRAHEEQMSPDCSEDMDDSDSLVSERRLSSGSRAEGSGFNFSPAWALAFFGEGYFSPKVVQYAVNLGQHRGSPCLDVKTQVGKLKTYDAGSVTHI